MRELSSESYRGPAGTRHPSSASFAPFTCSHTRILNSNGQEVAVANSNHSALLLVLMANAGSEQVLATEAAKLSEASTP